MAAGRTSRLSAHGPSLRGHQTLFEGPPEHFTHCRDALGCERLDHGYNMLTKPDIVNRAACEHVPFTMACWSLVELQKSQVTFSS
jgi:adenosine deaminase